MKEQRDMSMNNKMFVYFFLLHFMYFYLLFYVLYCLLRQVAFLTGSVAFVYVIIIYTEKIK